nr:uncharacterized protein LOC123760338 [Procambarus clarkii]
MWPSVGMWTSTYFLIILCVALRTVFSDDEKAVQFCTEDANANDLKFNCLCPSVNDTLIIQDKKISYGKSHINIPDNVTCWRIVGCSAVHLSGTTLTSLKHIHTLQLHKIDHIHLAYDFFLQYNTPLETLQLSHSTFEGTEGSLNIHAHNLKIITLEDIIWKGQLNILIQIQEGHVLDLVSIKNCKIEVLGEINLSPRYVHTFALENNYIGTVSTGAIIQESEKTIIHHNYVGYLSFLSLDTDTHNFTLQANTIKNVALESLVVSNATFIQIINNEFFHIESFGLTSLHSTSQEGSMVFSDNIFHKHEPGSLIFYSTVFNKKLIIQNNVFKSTNCNCSFLSYIRKMTEINDSVTHSFTGEREKAYELFIDSSLCFDKERKYKLSYLCKESELNHYWVFPAIALVTIMFTGLLVTVVINRHMCSAKYTRLFMESEEMDQHKTHSVSAIEKIIYIKE